MYNVYVYTYIMQNQHEGQESYLANAMLMSGLVSDSLNMSCKWIK